MYDLLVLVIPSVYKDESLNEAKLTVQLVCNKEINSQNCFVYYLTTFIIYTMSNKMNVKNFIYKI